MNKNILLLLIFFSITLSNCTKNERETLSLNVEVNDFVWKGMNTYYLWQEEIPVLDDERYSSQENLYSFLEGYENPSELFESLKFEPETTDKWSWIVDDYIELEAYFQGISKSSGAKIKLYLTAENSTDVFGIIRYIVPNTDAASKPIERGDVFNSVNGVHLTISNYTDLLYTSDSYTLNLGTYSYNTTTETVEITPNGESVTLVNGVYAENPVHIQNTFDSNGHKIGYLMYNSFTSNYNQELNNAFQYFKSEAVTDLILDLRYNGGGSVQTAGYLASMITGQFNGEILTREEWNPKWQNWLEENHPDWLVNSFTNTMSDGTTINNLNLSSLIILTTGNSASASELVINALNPYIDVVTIGTTTHGKYVASITLYDSQDFSRAGANPDHLWAMQPIVLKEVNSIGEYAPDGFSPSITIGEDFNNMGVLGTETERLTARAINYITTGNKSSSDEVSFKITSKKQLKNQHPLENEMYIEKEHPFERI